MARNRDGGGWEYWARTGPARRVKGGIKARSKRGGFAETWWGRRWIEILEGFDLSGRLARGRSYARRGQVADLEIDAGEVRASVQGSRARPYEVFVGLETYSDKELARISEALSERPLIAAQLASGEMSRQIEELFSEIGLPLFPERSEDLETDCSCPDWSNPCKHIAAVHYLLAEALDANPFLLFELRGLERSDLFGARESGAPSPMGEREPLPADPKLFWGEEAETPPGKGVPSVPVLTAAVPKSLGPFPFWRGNDDLLAVLEPLYQSATSTALEFLERDPSGTGVPDRKKS